MYYQNILSTNIYAKSLRPKFIIMGECLKENDGENLKNFLSSWENIFMICLEQFHYNQLMAKLVDILALADINEVNFLTPDGSPHCAQVHFSGKYLKRIYKDGIEFNHFVLNQDGEIYKARQEDIDASKRFSLYPKSQKI